MSSSHCSNPANFTNRSSERKLMNVGCKAMTCFSCYVYSDNYFQLDGTNHDSPLDLNYSLEHSGWANSIYWRGFQGSLVMKNESTGRWEIRDNRTNIVLGRADWASFHFNVLIYFIHSSYLS